MNRFGKTQTIYASNLNELRKRMREEQYEDENALNELVSDNARKNTKKILVDMLEKAIDSDLLTKNVAKQLNTVISKEDKKERRVLTVSEAELFLGEAQSSFYYNLFVLAIETGFAKSILTMRCFHHFA